MCNRYLLCAATVREMDACLNPLGLKFSDLPRYGELAWARKSPTDFREGILAVTGVGIPLTMARLLPLAAEYVPTFILNIGIAGAYVGSDFGVGDLVAGESETFGDLGLESSLEDAFIPLSVLPWADEIYKQPISLTLSPLDFEVKALMGIIPTAVGIIPTAVLPRVGRGCTVNTCTGQSTTGERRRKLFSADFETMEGAAIALTAQMLGLPASELRSISNMASTRDMRPENVELALRNLGMFMSEWIKKT